MIRMCDMDGDGQVSFDEFQTMIFKYAGVPASFGDEEEDEKDKKKPTMAAKGLGMWMMVFV
jgi:hypothetical protein